MVAITSSSVKPSWIASRLTEVVAFKLLTNDALIASRSYVGFRFSEFRPARAFFATFSTFREATIYTSTVYCQGTPKASPRDGGGMAQNPLSQERNCLARQNGGRGNL